MLSNRIFGRLLLMIAISSVGALAIEARAQEAGEKIPVPAETQTSKSDDPKGSLKTSKAPTKQCGKSGTDGRDGQDGKGVSGGKGGKGGKGGSGSCDDR